MSDLKKEDLTLKNEEDVKMMYVKVPTKFWRSCIIRKAETGDSLQEIMWGILKAEYDKNGGRV